MNSYLGHAFFWFVTLVTPAFGSVLYDVSAVSLRADLPGEVALMSGKTLKLNTPLTRGRRLLFEDLLPSANWTHPALFRVVDNSGKTLETAPSEYPPMDLDRATVLAGTPQLGNAVSFHLNDFQGKFHVASPAHFYAFLINGQASQRHWNDFSFLYQTLVKVYGYNPSQIFVADSAYKNSHPDLAGSGSEAIQYGSTAEDIRQVFSLLKTKLTSADRLLIVVNDHGARKNGESTILLKDGEMPAHEFSALVRGLTLDSAILIFEQCYGGGFVRPTLGTRRIAMSASTDVEYSWATKDGNFDAFLYRLVSAFARQQYDGSPVDADIDQDAAIVAREAFSYAEGHDDMPESPLLETLANMPLAFKIGLDR